MPVIVDKKKAWKQQQLNAMIFAVSQVLRPCPFSHSKSNHINDPFRRTRL